MTLGEFKNHIVRFENGKTFKYGISGPFSWRGIYAEVAFSVFEGETSKEDILENIEAALSETFYGYKGGDFRYDENTSIHFEQDDSSYTDGKYCENWLAEITNQPKIYSQEEKLVKKMFPES